MLSSAAPLQRPDEGDIGLCSPLYTGRYLGGWNPLWLLANKHRYILYTLESFKKDRDKSWGDDCHWPHLAVVWLLPSPSLQVHSCILRGLQGLIWQPSSFLWTRTQLLSQHYAQSFCTLLFNCILTEVTISLSLPRTVLIYACCPGVIIESAPFHFSLLTQFRWQISTYLTLSSGVTFHQLLSGFKFKLQHEIYIILPLFPFPPPTVTNTLDF